MQSSPDTADRPDLPQLHFGVLGSLRIQSGDVPVQVGPLRQRVALAILLCRANRVVPVSDISDAIWRTGAPRSAHKNVQVYISLLRGALFPSGDAERLVYTFPGYRIRLAPAELDVLRYEELARSGRAAARQGDIAAAARALQGALRMWRGPALADLATLPVIEDEAARLNDHRVAVYEDWAEAELRLGNHALVLEDIDDMVRLHPTRERLRWVQMIALSRSGRHVKALAEYDDLRVSLSRELGLEPSAALQRLYKEILTGDSPDRPAGGVAHRAASAREVLAHTAQLPRDMDDFTGRAAELSDLVATMGNAEADAVKVAVIGGPPGVGKTTLAVRAAHQLRRRFHDGQLFMNMRAPRGRPRTASDVLGQLLRMLGLEGSLPRRLEERAALYRAYMAERSILVLIDNVSDSEVARWLLPGTGRSGVLITSRRRLLALDATRHLVVRPFAEEEAVALLARMVNDGRIEAEPAAANLVATRCGGLPLAIRIAGTKLRLQPHLSVPQLADRLSGDRRLLGALQVGDLSLDGCARAFESELSPQDWGNLRGLGRLPSARFSPGDIAAVLGVRDQQAERVLDALLEVHAVEVVSDGQFALPRWLHAYLRHGVT